MWTLRLFLIIVGLVFLVWLFFYTRRHPPRKRRREADGGQGMGSTSADGVPAPEQDSAAAGDRSPASIPATPVGDASARERLFVLVLRFPGNGVDAERVIQALKRTGLQPGEQQIYHRIGTDGVLLYRVADLFEPGILYPLAPEARLRGLTFFSRAEPGADASMRVDHMLGGIRQCAGYLGGRIEDGSHCLLTAARELQLKLQAAGATHEE